MTATKRNEYKVYEFVQNNAGGGFIVDKMSAEVVYVQARNAQEANKLAVAHSGVYFDGNDCDCCGDRWERVYELEGGERGLMYVSEKLSFEGVKDSFPMGYQAGWDLPKTVLFVNSAGRRELRLSAEALELVAEGI